MRALHSWLLPMLLLALIVTGCEGSGDEATDAGADVGADLGSLDAEADGDGPRETTPVGDGCCVPDTVEVEDAVDAADSHVPADVPSDPGTPDVPHPTGCCETIDDCPEGSVCLGLDFGPPGTCWPAPGEGECFFDDDCAAGEACLGEKHTNCMMSSLPHPGTCVEGPRPAPV